MLIRVGSRGSRLALTQAELAASRLRATGVEIATSANLIQSFEARWSPEQFESHLEAGRRVDQTLREAWEFIKYMNTANPRAQRFEELQGMELLCYGQQKNSALREWSPFFTNHHPHPHIDVFRKLSASPHAVCVPNMGIWTEYEREMLTAFAQIRLLIKTPEEALGEAQQRLQASWDRHFISLARHHQPLPTSDPAAP